MRKITLICFTLSALFHLVACSNPQPGPDKTISGALLGAAWGAGAGAVVGNQLEFDPVGEGAAVGAGLGMVSGALQGAGYDLAESALIDQQEQLDQIKIQNAINAQQIASLQQRLDYQHQQLSSISPLHQIYFDVDSTTARSGAIASLEKIADSLKLNAGIRLLIIAGHTDDSGDPKYNDKLALARARNVVQHLAARGIATDRMIAKSYGATRPVASNNTETGRQLNRRVEIIAKTF